MGDGFFTLLKWFLMGKGRSCGKNCTGSSGLHAWDLWSRNPTSALFLEDQASVWNTYTFVSHVVQPEMWVVFYLHCREHEEQSVSCGCISPQFLEKCPFYKNVYTFFLRLWFSRLEKAAVIMIVTLKSPVHFYCYRHFGKILFGLEKTWYAASNNSFSILDEVTYRL